MRATCNLSAFSFLKHGQLRYIATDTYKPLCVKLNAFLIQFALYQQICVCLFTGLAEVEAVKASSSVLRIALAFFSKTEATWADRAACIDDDNIGEATDLPIHSSRMYSIGSNKLGEVIRTFTHNLADVAMRSKTSDTSS
jgi:hypothetical protein